MGELLVDLGTGEWKLQEIGSCRGVEDVGIGSHRELKAVRGWRMWVLIPIEN